MTTAMERPLIDMKAVEMAAQSPDPRVRGVALRRLEIEREIGPLDGFLSFYCTEAAMVVPVVAVVADLKKSSPVRPVNGAAKDAPKDVPKGKTERNIDTMKQVIAAHGQPMSLQALFDTMQRDHPAQCWASPESMRARLAEHKDKLIRCNGGYWPADMEVPTDA
jgi:hypothetical protein